MLTSSFESLSSTGAQASLEEALGGHPRGAPQEMLEEELGQFLNEMRGERTDDGRQAVVRNGCHKEQFIQTALGLVPVFVPRARDRSVGGDGFQSAIIPHCKRRSVTLDKAVCYF